MKSYKGFNCIVEHNFKGVNVHCYVSKNTGITVALAEVNSPLVNAYITVSTEASNHNGCPHVLEHLVFLGSDDYPYKGILDKAANRCFAQV